MLVIIWKKKIPFNAWKMQHIFSSINRALWCQNLFFRNPQSIPGNIQHFRMTHASKKLERTNKGIGAHGTDGGNGNNLGKRGHILFI